MTATLSGIDVSAIGQGTSFNWAAYAGRISFAFAKATEGLAFQDPAYIGNYQQMSNLLITPGAYHYLRPGDDGAQQAAHFLSVVRPQPGDLMMVDVETADGRTAAQVAQCAHDFAMEVRARTRAWPFVYTTIHMAEFGYVAACSACPAWIANPGAAVLPVPIGPWRSVVMQQTGQRGVDTDTFYGTLDQLDAYAVPQPRPSRGAAQAALRVLQEYI